MATGAFELTPTEIALLERAVLCEALVLCAGDRVLLDVLASPAEQELFDTPPAEQRSAIASAGAAWSSQRPTRSPPRRPGPGAQASTSADRPSHLFDDLDPDPDCPIPCPVRRRHL